MATWTQFKKKVTRERETTLRGIVNWRENEIDKMDTMIDQLDEDFTPENIRNIAEEAKVEEFTVYQRLYDLNILPLC